jgi:hypothetical protein
LQQDVQRDLSVLAKELEKKKQIAEIKTKQKSIETKLRERVRVQNSNEKKIPNKDLC